MKFNSGGQFENPPAGNHLARCIALIDLGTQAVQWMGESKLQRKVLIRWELPNTKMEGVYDPTVKGKPFGTSRRFTQSLAANAALKKFLEGWRGRKFKAEELAAFEPNKLLGSVCMLNLVESEDGQYINIDSLSPRRLNTVPSNSPSSNER
ncbi:hypothetical protein CCP3SC15_7090003 [Gammaproteobacteria bacterium]